MENGVLYCRLLLSTSKLVSPSFDEVATMDTTVPTTCKLMDIAKINAYIHELQVFVC